MGDTYTFNTQSGEFTNLNFSIGSHGQHVFDYEQDGDEDIISNDFGNIVASGNPFILRNDGENNFSVVMVPQPDFIETGRLRYSAMSAAAYYESGYLKVVYTDFDVSKELDNKWGIEAEKNVVVTYEPNDLTVVDVTQLPDPYSEENFVNLEYYNQSWIGSNGLSHDVRSTPIDIDYDGDIDIVIGSQVYGENISLPQILINNNGVFEDQTESRLFNWVFATGSIHRWDFADVNGDGYLDIITKDGCNNLIEASNGELIDLRPNGCELKVAVNDGTGHFISIIEPTHILQVFEGNEFKTGRILPIFAMDQNRNLSWVYADGKGCNGCYNEGNHEIFTVKLDGILNTGPNGMNPAIRGEPGFNEFYYLLHHTDAREAVSSGQYDNGLEHYIAVGKDLGYSPNAKSSTNVTVDSYSINPIHTVKSKYVNLVPSITSSATFSAAENQTAIGTVTATDVENDTLTYSIGGSDLTINSSSGVIAFASAPDYETKTSYSATVTATDGTNSTTQSITVNVTNVNDNSPAFTSSATFSADENQTSIGTVTATDGDASDSVTFTVSGSELSITSAGVLTFVSAPDYETKSSYTATVTATDGTNSTDQSITVSVNDVNEAPAFTALATFSADEKQTSIGTVTATDIENDTLTYSVTGTDASAVTVDSSTGVLTFNAGPDYETQSSYSVTAEVSDGSLSTTQAITISINETEFEVYGTAYASKYFVMDGDIPNTDYIANDNSNNSLSGAQSILNPTVVSGYTGHAGDTYDLFVVSTSSNMYVNLDVVDYVSGTTDLDIYIYNSDGSERDFSYVSGSTEGNETINLPNGGTYVIQVYPIAGSSPYLLTVGQRLTSSQASTGHGDFSPNEILSYIPFTPRLTQSSRAEHIARLSTPEIKKRVSDLKLPKTVLEHTPALRKIGSEFLINKFKKQLDADLNPVLKMSDKQKIYLSHWKAIQRLEEINPMANYELNYTVERMANFSADPLYNYQWNLRQINLEAALNAVGQEVKDVAVAVIDSGSPSVNSDAWNATDFIAGGYDFVASTSNGDGDGIDNDPTDPDASDAALVSHGVHVGTTIGMKNDGAGFNGMAVKVLPLRVFPETPEEGKPLASRYDIKEAILYAAGLSNSSGTIAPTTIPVKVINLSLGGSSAWDCSIFTDVAAQGITVVAASGNDGNETPGAYNYPASCTNVVSVGATDSLDQRTSYSQYNNMVDIAAPGGSEIDSDADGTADYVPAWGNNTQKFGLPGTSMASPQVAGAIALLYAIDTNMSPSTVNTYLQAGYLTDDIGASGYDTSFGYGRLNVAKAIENTLSNIGDTTTTFFSADTSYLNFGDSTNQLSITFSKVGNASLSVSSLSADDASGLSYSSSVDSNGAGTYTIYIDRSEVPNGAFQNRLYFNLSNSSQVSVSLYYEVGGARSRANLGKVFIGLYNSDDSLAASGSLAMDGTLSFVANDIVDGEYYFLVSSNNDDDGYVCDYGEFCARYPDTEGAQTFTVSGADLSGGEIYLDPIFRFGGINAASNMSQPSYNLDIAQPAGSASQSIFKVEALDSDGSEDESNTTIPEGTIPISPN
ncbi:S8 family serine peptidase [Porticoccaceae bacterium]|nr:S8 family serine peptidase [Porticoccaceae bacterium]